MLNAEFAIDPPRASTKSGSLAIPTETELKHRRSRNALEVAHILANEYGHILEPTNYVRGVAMSGRLRLHTLDDGYPDPSADLAAIVDPLLTDESFHTLGTSDGSKHAGFVWADELSETTGDPRYADFLLRFANLYLTARSDGFPVPVDADYRVEDLFFVGAIVGRAFAITGDRQYADAMASVFQKVHAQPDSGLFWHCKASPYYWGRGNAFAALEFAEALSYLPKDHASRDALIQKHTGHLNALITHQDRSGAWRQVINRPDSYLELTATAMLGYTIARGIQLGYLESGFEEAAHLAWSAVSERVDDDGNVYDSCTGTGPLASLQEYIDRPTENGHDDRGGSMALWFATEYERMSRALRRQL